MALRVFSCCRRRIIAPTPAASATGWPRRGRGQPDRRPRSSLNDIDGLLSLTTYRVIQESVTNVLRHAHAGAIDVAAEITGAEVAIEVADDREGFPPDSPFGRGLRGMDERVRALLRPGEWHRRGALNAA